jgi:hypothetical protein
MGSTIEVILTILALSFWILFPIGIFLSVSKLDKNSDQLIRMEELRHEKMGEEEFEVEQEREERRMPIFQPVPFDWHHPIIYFRRWLQHE